jgi:hypothetical protein
MTSRGGTVNGRTLAQLEAQRERWRAMERADWKRRRRYARPRHSSGRTPAPGRVIERRDGAR